MATRTLGFTGSIPENYDRLLGPILFEGFAEDLAMQVAADLNQNRPSLILEIACGSGILTRALDPKLPAGSRIVATDLSASMVNWARTRVKSDLVEFATIDGQVLPLQSESVDAVVCQFGMMFMPDPKLALAEMMRVVRPGGMVYFNVWSPRKENPIWDAMENSLGELLPSESGPFLPTPFLLSEYDQLTSLLKSVGAKSSAVELATRQTGRHYVADLAQGFIEGTPLGGYVLREGFPTEVAIDHLILSLGEILGDPFQGLASAWVCQLEKH